MRIAYVTETYPPEINGVALTAERTVAHLRNAGHAVQLVRPRQRGEAPHDDASEWRSLGAPIPLYPDLQLGLARAGTLRRRWARQVAGPPDLVHVATPGPLGWAALHAARASGICTTADFRTNFHAYSRHYGLALFEPLVLSYLRRLHAMADRTFTPTPEMARRLARDGFSRLAVTGRGVDVGRFSPRWRSASLRRFWGAVEPGPVLLHVGRLAPEKSVELALDTYERLREQQPTLQMVVVGDGPLRTALQRAHPSVCFVGTQVGDALARHYASADIFLFPSLTETFGNVTLEALASGLVVVAFDTAAAAVHVRNGIDGHLAEPSPAEDGASAFLAATTRALASAAPGSPMRQAAVEAARRANWDQILSGFERQLQAVVRSAALEGHPHAAVV